MKAIGQYFPAGLFIIVSKVVLTFESTDEIIECDQSNESYCSVLSCGAVYYCARWLQVTFESDEEILKCDHSSESY